MTKQSHSVAHYAASEDPLTDLEILVGKLTATTSETRNIEWKLTGLFGNSVTVRTKYRVVKAVVSFANTDGGFILFGVHSDGSWVGLADEDLEQFDPAKVTELVNGVVFPEIPIINYGEFEYKSAKFALVHVPPSKIAPHTTTKPINVKAKDGKKVTVIDRHVVYYRHGAKSASATPAQLQKIVERRTEYLRSELLRRVTEVQVPVLGRIDHSTGKNPQTTMSVTRLTKDPNAPAIRITRAESGAAGVLLHEELSEGLFDEINNVLDANKQLAGEAGKFVLGREVYYRIYAERNHVELSRGFGELLLRTAFRDIYSPYLFWLSRSDPKIAAQLILESLANPKQPIVIAAFTAVTLVGTNASEWVKEYLDKKYKGISQKPEFFWTYEKMINRTAVSDRRLLAMRTTKGAILKVPGNGEFAVANVLTDSELAANLLSRLCIEIFNGKGGAKARSVARRLDMAAYGADVQEVGPAIWEEIKSQI